MAAGTWTDAFTSSFFGVMDAKVVFRDLSTGARQTYSCDNFRDYQNLRVGKSYKLSQMGEYWRAILVEYDPFTAVVGFGLHASLGVEGTSQQSKSADRVLISVLDVGQGDATLMTNERSGFCGLIDYGSKKNAHVLEPIVSNHIITALQTAKKLKQYQLADPYALELDFLCITHGDADHYNQLQPFDVRLRELGLKLQVRTAWCGGTLHDYPAEFVNLIRSWLRPSDSNPKYFTDQKFPWTLISSDNIEITALSANQVPTHGESVKNCSSLVCLITVQAKAGAPVKYLVMGDAEITVEKNLIEKMPGHIDKIDALRVGHHGSSHACTSEFLAACAPRIAYISTDAKWAHPYPDTMARLRACSSLQANQPHHNVLSPDRDRNNYSRALETDRIFTTLVDQEPDVSGSDVAMSAAANGFVPVLMTGARHDFFVDLETGVITTDDTSEATANASQQPRELEPRK
jgi:beta-lactamase superfamily II metal-dependent hydrolase